ncbi:MAG: ABC transporter permease [Symploca sp. SIO3C6]|uniref:ABC transporter permease n=1 Tax=Symploca sp. SIO1C4 TaxID=2607765 RepID=A0A6B3NIT0_9CYAN|nr:ABC transporter permease [Symploca sp. SIO3C6]NER29974.1 ABC transporter permease [Symploca sp. SIO1C4]
MANNSITFFSDYLVASVHLSVPLAFAAIGGLFSERSGVLNIALEGMLLTGAFISAAVVFYTNNAWVGIVAALVVAGLVGLVHAYLCVSLGVNQLVSGLAINLAAAGLTSFGARIVFDSTSVQQIEGISAIAIWGLQRIPLLGKVLFNQDPLVYFLFFLVPLSTYWLFNTSLGLSLRAVGEYPKAAEIAGVSVVWLRYFSVIFSGCLSGLGGAYLSLVHVKFFTEGISAGKGFIALAAVIFGRWHPVGVTSACLLFGATEALQLRIQAFNLNIPYQFLLMLPYVIALLALIGLAGKSRPPAALGIPYDKEREN